MMTLKQATALYPETVQFDRVGLIGADAEIRELAKQRYGNATGATLGLICAEVWKVLARQYMELIDAAMKIEWATVCHWRTWPLTNAWEGVSVEDRSQLHRIDFLRETPAQRRGETVIVAESVEEVARVIGVKL